MNDIKTIEQLDPKGKRVLLRVDFNVPINDGVVADDTRIQEAIPTIKYLIDHGARLIIAAHLGRPSGTGYEREYSLRPVALHLSQKLCMPVYFSSDTIGPDAKAKAAALKDGEILMLENLRFDKREKKCDPEFTKELASLADVYVGDAFGAAHRAHASISGVCEYLPSYAGFLMEREVKALTGMLENPRHPFVAILGGSKVSDKIQVIDALLDKVDTLIIGGGMCFTFLVAQGYTVGTSLKEDDWVDQAAAMIEKAKRRGVKLLLPVDVVCSKAFVDTKEGTQVAYVDAIPDDMMGLDIGPRTSRMYANAIAEASTVFWNGPMGVFEMKSFERGTKVVCVAVAAAQDADTVIGGGDSVAAVNKYGLGDLMTFISTGGGASMELLKGEVLPGVAALS